MKNLKIAFLMNGRIIDNYLMELIAWARSQPGLEVRLITVTNNFNFRHDGKFSLFINPRNLYKMISKFVFRCITVVEGNFLKFNKHHSKHLEKIPLIDAFDESLILNIQVTDSDYNSRPDKSDLAHVFSLNLDLLVQIGGEMPCVQLLKSSRLGAIALNYYNNGSIDDFPPGFWESYLGIAKTGFEIRHRTVTENADRILLRGSFATKFWFLLNQACLYRKSNAQLIAFLDRFLKSGTFPSVEISQPFSGQRFRIPSIFQSINYIAKIAFRVATKLAYKIVNYRQKWGISISNADWTSLVLSKSKPISAPRGHFWADPFLCSNENKTYCFVEDFEYKRNRGHITALEITNEEVIDLGPCIKEEFHLSFPFLFRYNGNLFMCPESSKSGQIRIYKSKVFPSDWELHSIAMEGVSAADSMFFEKNGKWWMLTNIDHSGLSDHCSGLYLFHSKSPVGTAWFPHAKNPLRVDPDGGRNAGLILEGARVIRAAQRQGFDQYGNGLLFYEIDELSETVYSERLVSEIKCDYRRGLLGSHHLSTTGGITVVDHVERCFFP